MLFINQLTNNWIQLAVAQVNNHAHGHIGLEVWPNWAWAAFILFVLAMLTLDLGVLHKKAHEVSMKEALLWCVFWISLAVAFGIFLLFTKGKPVALEFFTGYIIEYSLSMDNIFVFILIFTYFSVPKEFQHRILFWGIVGALVMRAALIFAGVALIHKFEWIVYLFGALLIFSGIKMVFSKNKKFDPEKNPVVKVFKRFFPVTEVYHGQKFFISEKGKLIATPMFVILLLIEATDLVFAVDSIPAILAITTNTFIVFTSNIFAILGLRALYFALAGVMGMFRYLSIGLSAVLIFVGFKMIANGIVGGKFIPTEISLLIVAGLIFLSIMASVLTHKKGDISNAH